MQVFREDGAWDRAGTDVEGGRIRRSPLAEADREGIAFQDADVRDGQEAASLRGIHWRLKSTVALTQQHGDCRIGTYGQIHLPVAIEVRGYTAS
jgi:hypothetical protein